MSDKSMFDDDAELTTHAVVIAHTVIAIRTAQGKNIPSNFPVGSSEWDAAAVDFAQDVARVLGSTTR